MAGDDSRDERLAAFAQLVDQRFTVHEELDDERFKEIKASIAADFKSFETLIRSSLDHVVEIHDAKAEVLKVKLEAQKVLADARTDLVDSKNVPFRVALGIVGGALLTALVGLLLTTILSTHSLKAAPAPVPAAQEGTTRK